MPIVGRWTQNQGEAIEINAPSADVEQIEFDFSDEDNSITLGIL